MPDLPKDIRRHTLLQQRTKRIRKKLVTSKKIPYQVSKLLKNIQTIRNLSRTDFTTT